MITRIALPTAAALLAAALLAAPAAAQTERGGQTHPPGSRGGLYSAAWLVSDYRYQGVSSSDRHAAVQGGVHYFRPDGWYAGLFVSTVDFNDYGTSFELDVYGGKTLKLNKQTDLKLQVLYTTFPDNQTPGPTYDFVQGGVSLIRREGPLTLTVLTTYVPDGSYATGQIWRAGAGADYALNKTLTLKTLAGRTWIERGQSRTYWSLGAAAKWRFLTFEARYQDTDLGKRQCGFNPDICGPSLSGSVMAEFPLILF